MANELAILEQQLQRDMLPKMAQALAHRIEPEQFMRTILVSCEKTPKLLDCTRGSLFSAAMTAAFLGLPVDGVTGQGFLVPYNDNKTHTKLAQFQTGYKGLNTLGARSGYSIGAAVVREGDEFDFQLGTGAYVKHRPSLSGNGRIIAAWAVAESKTLEPLISVLKLADIEAVKGKSKAVGDSGFSPWQDPAVGYPAMAEKTARRRLARSMPLNIATRDYHLAARIEEAFQEQALTSNIREDGQLIVDGRNDTPFPREQESSTPSAQDIIGPKPDREIEGWKADLMAGARQGMSTLRGRWDVLAQQSPRLSHLLKDYLEKECKPIAEAADRSA